MSTTDLIEQFADGEPVAPDALVAALATENGREHLRGILELRALMAETPVSLMTTRIAAPASSPWITVTRIAAAALIGIAAAAGGYLAGSRQANTPMAIRSIQAADMPPAPTTVIKLDATHGWRDQSGGF